MKRVKTKKQKIRRKIISKLLLVSALITRFYLSFFEMPINGMSNQLFNILTAFACLSVALYIVSLICKDIANEKYKRSRRKQLIKKIKEAKTYEERKVNYE